MTITAATSTSHPSGAESSLSADSASSYWDKRAAR